MNQNQRRRAFTVAVIAYSLLSGCATSGLEATGTPGADPKFAKHLVLHNEALADKIMITAMNTRRTGGLLEVNVVLTNQSATSQSIQYQFSWYDSDSFEIEQGKSPWTPAVLHGKASLNMQAVAPNDTVTTYKVNVREN